MTINSRDIIRMTDLMCDSCGLAEFAVVVGWESMTALRCTNPECVQYHYFVGKVQCSNTYNTDGPNHSPDVLRKALDSK